MTTELKQDLGALAACLLLGLIHLGLGLFMAALVVGMMVQNFFDGVYSGGNDGGPQQ